MRTGLVLPRLASVLALVIGAMAVFAGGQALLGRIPDYYVIDWLPIYNLALGVVSAIVASVLIWRKSRLALPTALTIFGLHGGVMLVLLTAYRQVVVVDSLRAMSIRLAAWTVILILLLATRRKRA